MSTDRPTTRGRTLLGPGPSNVHPRVYEALGRPLVGHLDPRFLELMDDLQSMLRRLFATQNRLTMAVSGTGSAGMEATLVNVVEPGDEVLICVNGVFGNRMCEIVERLGGVLHRLDRPWGEVFDLAEISAVLDRHPAIGLVGIVHAETSTGAQQPIAELGGVCRQRDALLLVDAVTSLGGTDLQVDDWKIDLCYSGTQKCLSCPPGLAPVTVGPRAVDKIHRRSSKIGSWYLDLTLIEDYWSESKRTYHHTAPISMNFALHEALKLALEEGLEERFDRHRRHSKALLAGLHELGIEPFVAPTHRLPMLNCVNLPEGFPEADIRRDLLERHDIEVGGGLGELSGRVWRVGLMGESARRKNVVALLEALDEVLYRRGLPVEPGVAAAAAQASYASSAVS